MCLMDDVNYVLIDTNAYLAYTHAHLLTLFRFEEDKDELMVEAQLRPNKKDISIQLVREMYTSPIHTHTCTHILYTNPCIHTLPNSMMHVQSV